MPALQCGVQLSQLVGMPPAVAIMASMLLGLVIGDRYVPDAPLKMKVYRELSDAKFKRMREETELSARKRGVALKVSSMADGEAFFELWAHGQPIMLVDNSSMQLLVAVAGDSREGASDLRELKQSGRARMRPD